MKNGLKGSLYVLMLGIAGGLLSHYFPLVLISIIFMFMIYLSIRMWALCKFERYESCVRIWASFTGLTAVRVMDYNHDVIYTLVQQQSDGSYTGHHNYVLKLSSIRLMQNGYVDPECDSAWCYIWQPINPQLQTQLQLSYWDTWPNWDLWLSMDHLQMVAQRRTHLSI